MHVHNVHMHDVRAGSEYALHFLAQSGKIRR